MKWQEQKCKQLQLPFNRYHGSNQGGPNVLLTRPKKTSTIRGDGNCLFRCLSHVLTGTQMHYDLVHRAVLAHMYDIADFMIGPFGTSVNISEHQTKRVHSVSEDISVSKMDRKGTWGTDMEINVITHLLQTAIYVYQVGSNNVWLQFPPNQWDLFTVTDPAIYVHTTSWQAF